MKIKGFDKNLCCRGMQYEVGTEYTTGAKNITESDLCTDKVLHYCDSLQRVHNYYSCSNEENRYCEIEVLGEEVTDGEKYGSNHIKIIREITGNELKRMKGLERGNTGFFNSGYRNSGYRNSGYRNSGDRNSGDLNSGDLNSGYRNSGVFCNKKIEDTVPFFNKDSNMTWNDWYNSDVYDISVNLKITEWIDWNNMDDKEKKDNPKAFVCGGYLKVYEYKDAWKNLWDSLTDGQKSLFKELPNFDSDIFEDITGIRIE